MDKVKAIMSKGKEKEQEPKQKKINRHSDYKNPIAAAEWAQFLNSTHYTTTLPPTYHYNGQQTIHSIHQNALTSYQTINFQTATSVHPLEIQSRVVILMDAFNTYRGTASGNQLLVSDLAYYKLALATAESEAQEFEFDEKDNSMDIATQNHGLGMGINDTSTSTWHPVFGPGYTRPAPRSYAPSLLNWHVDLERTAGQQKALPFYCSGTSARLSRAPTFGSSDVSDCESVSDTLNDDSHINVSDEWVIHQSRSFGVSREEMVMTKKENRGTTITNCTALINHNHSCTAPMDLFPASPALSSVSTLTLIPTPMKTGIEYTGPVPSEMMEKVLNEHINADVENANAETASQKKKRVCEFRILVAIVAFYVTLSIMAFAGAIVIATQKDQTNCDGSCSGKDLF